MCADDVNATSGDVSRHVFERSNYDWPGDCQLGVGLYVVICFSCKNHDRNAPDPQTGGETERDSDARLVT